MCQQASAVRIDTSCFTVYACTRGVGWNVQVLIMDEVDGMSGGDRGGASGIAELITSSRSPIICICNDAHDKKLTPLKRVSLALTFMRCVRACVRA